MSIYVKCGNSTCRHNSNGCAHSRVHEHIRQCVAGCKGGASDGKHRRTCFAVSAEVEAYVRLTGKYQKWDSNVTRVDYD